jgi:hypothetical protein
MTDPDPQDRTRGVVEALRRQASGAVDASIPVNPKDLLVLIAAYDAAARTALGAPAQNPITARYHGTGALGA